MIPIEGHTNLFRDEKSGAIVNVNTYEYNNYIKLRKERQNQKDEITELKKDVHELKSLLMEIINARS